MDGAVAHVGLMEVQPAAFSIRIAIVSGILRVGLLALEAVAADEARAYDALHSRSRQVVTIRIQCLLREGLDAVVARLHIDKVLRLEGHGQADGGTLGAVVNFIAVTVGERTAVHQLLNLAQRGEVERRIVRDALLQLAVVVGVGESLRLRRVEASHVARAVEVGYQLLRRDRQPPVGIGVCEQGLRVALRQTRGIARSEVLHIVALVVDIVVVHPCRSGVHQERTVIATHEHLVDGIGGTVGDGSLLPCSQVDDALVVEGDAARRRGATGVGGLGIV